MRSRGKPGMTDTSKVSKKQKSQSISCHYFNLSDSPMGPQKTSVIFDKSDSLITQHCVYSGVWTVFTPIFGRNHLHGTNEITSQSDSAVKKRGLMMGSSTRSWAQVVWKGMWTA